MPSESSAAAPRSAVLPLPGSPRSSSAPPRPARAPETTHAIRASAASRPMSTGRAYQARAPPGRDCQGLPGRQDRGAQEKVIARIEAGGHDDRANVHIVATGKDEAVFGRLRRSPVAYQAPVERPVRSTNRYPWVAYQSMICGRAARVFPRNGETTELGSWLALAEWSRTMGWVCVPIFVAAATMAWVAAAVTWSGCFQSEESTDHSTAVMPSAEAAFRTLSSNPPGGRKKHTGALV